MGYKHASNNLYKMDRKYYYTLHNYAVKQNWIINLHMITLLMSRATQAVDYRPITGRNPLSVGADGTWHTPEAT